MIIKDDKLVQPELEPAVETPPPYSLAAHAPVDVTVAVTVPGVTPSPTHFRDPFPGGPPRPVQAAASGSSASALPVPDAHPLSALPPPPGVPRSACTHVRRKNVMLTGRFVVDPYLPLPPLPPDAGADAEEEEDYGGFGLFDEAGGRDAGERPNLRLENKNGSIDAEVWVVGGEGREKDDEDAGKKKATMDVRVKNGFVALKMNASRAAPSFALRVAAKNGGVRVYVPRRFVGPLTTRTRNGWVQLSPALAARVTNFSEVRGTRKGFVGNYAASGYGNGEWQGSSLDISCENGRIKLFFADEAGEKEKEGKGAGALLGRVFGLS
ncbi:hypothetical protein DFH11DRAFT_1876733 [Phellopilus nigrolimitatus]|nr:hypothetical protein DFH11DRAFT_1876733 [Phellopilus nigrolimitatus]